MESILFIIPFAMMFIVAMMENGDIKSDSGLHSGVNMYPECNLYLGDNFNKKTKSKDINIINLTIIENDSSGYSYKAEDLDQRHFLQ